MWKLHTTDLIVREVQTYTIEFDLQFRPLPGQNHKMISVSACQVNNICLQNLQAKLTKYQRRIQNKKVGTTGPHPCNRHHTDDPIIKSESWWCFKYQPSELHMLSHITSVLR